MARIGHAYPQVDGRAASLVDLPVVYGPADASVGDVLSSLRRDRARAWVTTHRRGAILRCDLERAARLGLQRERAVDLERTVPRVSAGDSEVVVRRHLLAGVPAVIVLDRHHVVGAISRSVVPDPAGSTMTEPQRQRLGGVVLELLTQVGAIARRVGARAFAVGGLVRDALMPVPRDAMPNAPAPRDVDIVIDGEGIEVARAVARALHGSLRIHSAFGTASIDGLPAGRLDIATARAERYRLPGALPQVRPGTIAEDLGRRDFTVNAIAVELATDGFRIVDPVGGRRDLARRRLCVLHPLSFVEDPTRILRAARYATRLGFALDRSALRAQALALGRHAYPALSGQRIAAELRRVVADADPDVTLRRLALSGGFRLLDRRLRYSRSAVGTVSGVTATRAWVSQHGMRADPLEVALLAVLSSATAEVSEAALRRLGLTGGPLARLLHARVGGPALAPDLRARPRASQRAERLRRSSSLELAEAWRVGGRAVRRQLDWFAETGGRVKPALGGEELVALGVVRGPAVGATLARLRDARLDGEIATETDELALVREWLLHEAGPRPQRARPRGMRGG